MHGRVITVSNQKGGVGKTTTVINLAHELTQLNQRVLIIDGDPQANATSGLAVKFSPKQTLYEVLLQKLSLADAIVQTRFSGLDIVPSKPELAGAQVELMNVSAYELRFRELIKTICKRYHFIFIDTPPSLGLLTLNAFSASESILIPIQCEYYALEGITQLLSTIKLVKERTNPQLALAGVVLTMYDARTKLAHEVAENVMAHFKTKTYRVIIPRNVKLSEAPSHGLPIGVYAPESLGARSYKLLAAEFMKNY